MKSEAESGLIFKLRTGDEEAFRFLVEKFQVNVIRTCNGFVHSLADAEDIAQDVFIEVYESAGKFRGESELSTWIYRIAVNKSLNFIRRAGRRKITGFIDTFLLNDNNNISEPVTGSEMAADTDIHRDEMAEAIRSALASLPANQKTAFVLSRYEELSYKEIADIMGSSIQSVESLLFRAKKNLQKRLFSFYKDNML